jgi:hypothetical protein
MRRIKMFNDPDEDEDVDILIQDDQYDEEED